MHIHLISRSLDLILHPLDYRGRQEIKEAKLERKYLKENKPQPLPSFRVNITQEHIIEAPLKLNGRHPSRLARDDNQSSDLCKRPMSPLLRLPAELRLQIYELVIGGQTIHLIRFPRHIRHIFLSPADPAEIPVPPHMPPQYNTAHQALLSTTGLPLLLTCRSMYKDAIKILYCSNVFSLNDLSVLVHWKDLPLLRPQRLQSIRHLSVEWVYYSDPMRYIGLTYEPYDCATWERFWQIVANEMPELRRLELALEYVGDWRQPKEKQPWISPVMYVKGIENSSVTIMERRIVRDLAHDGSTWNTEQCTDVEKAVQNAWRRPRLIS